MCQGLNVRRARHSQHPKNFSGRSQRALSLKDVEHGSVVVNFFAIEEAFWSTMDI